MKKILSVTIAIVMTVVLFAAIPVNAASAYVTDGLVAMYDGAQNSASGQNKNATVWADLSGNGNDIADMPKTDTCYFTDDAYVLDTVKINLPGAIDTAMAGEAFTVELRLGNITAKGKDFNTFINCPSDDFSLFRRVGGDFIEFKNTSNARPKVAGGLDYFENSTVAITFTAGGKCTLYVDGEQIGQTDAANKLPNTAGMFFGHDLDSRNYTAEFENMRFYSRALSAAEVAANAAADTAKVSSVKIDKSEYSIVDGKFTIKASFKNAMAHDSWFGIYPATVTAPGPSDSLGTWCYANGTKTAGSEIPADGDVVLTEAICNDISKLPDGNYKLMMFARDSGGDAYEVVSVVEFSFVPYKAPETNDAVAVIIAFAVVSLGCCIVINTKRVKSAL